MDLFLTIHQSYPLDGFKIKWMILTRLVFNFTFTSKKYILVASTFQISIASCKLMEPNLASKKELNPKLHS